MSASAGTLPPSLLRVALVTDSAEPSGMGEHMLTLARFSGEGVAPTLVLPWGSPSDGLSRRASAAGLPVKRFDPASDAFARWLDKARPDLVHVHAGIGWEGQELARAAADAGIPVLRTEHLPYLLTDPAQIAAHRASLGSVAKLIAVSDAAGRSFREAGLPSEKLAVVRNGIAPTAPLRDRAAMRQSLALSEDAPVFLTVARMTPQKGHRTLLDAFSRLLAGRRATLLLVGEGPEHAALAERAQAHGIAEGVPFLGQREDVPDLMAAADFLVLPSLFEGLPLVLLEAMAARLPVIATRAVGSLEAVGEDHPFLAEPGDPESLAGAMRAALEDPAGVEQATEALHRRFERKFHATRMGRQTARLYRDSIFGRDSSSTRQQSSMTRTRIGFIGAGGIANRHLGVLEQFEDVELAGFADTDFERASGTAERFGARAFASHREMLAGAELDAVYICVPPFAHGEIEEDVIAARLPFFVEKPVSLDIETARRIGAQVAQAGLVTGVGYHWRYLDTVDEARALFASNPPRLVSGYWLDATPPPQWWWREAMSGGQMVEQTTHILDLVRVLVGEVETVFGQAEHTTRDDFPGLDVATASTASLRFANGAVGNIASTCLLRWGHRVGLHLFADGLAVEMTDHDIMIDVGQGRPVRHAEGDPVWREDRDFVDAVQGKENRIRCSYAEALKTHELALAVNRSAASGQPIHLARPEDALREVAYG